MTGTAATENSGQQMGAAYRQTLPRIYELHDQQSQPLAADAYFRNFDQSLHDYPVKLKHFRDIEDDLGALDLKSWDYLKRRAGPLFAVRHSQRGCQAAFDLLNQAKAYRYLKVMGATGLRFVPESQIPGEKTPDLEGLVGDQTILCEVKTINISDIEAQARVNGSARSVQGTLPDAFFEKVRSSLRAAVEQMEIFKPNGTHRRLAYFVLNFDDNLNEYADRYRTQLDAFSASCGGSSIDLVFDMKPPFYSASA